jgi:hypothetical protein
MTETTLIRVSKDTKELMEKEKGELTMDEYVRGLVGRGVPVEGVLNQVETVYGVPPTLGVMVEGIDKKLDQVLVKLGNGSKPVTKPWASKDRELGVMMIEVEEYCDKYHERYVGKKDHIVPAVKAQMEEIRERIRSILYKEIDPMHGPGEG